jgi:signal transduction histidine kinase
LTDELSTLFGNHRDAVIALKDGEISYYNGAAVRLIPNIKELKPADILPEQLVVAGESFRGEASVAGVKTAVTVSELDNYRICVLASPLSEEGEETANFLTSAGVELKNMLSVLKLASGLLLPTVENIGNPKLDRYAAMIYHCVYSLLRLTNNLSDLGAILRGDAVLVRSRFDIVASCRELVGSAQHLIGDGGARAKLLFESAEDSLMITADRARVDRMLLNLLSNSLMSTQPGGAVTVSVVPAGDRVVLSVSDSGTGIGGDILPTAWNRYTADRELSQQAGGVGLGLTIVQSIARLHGGSAVLESRPGEGTTVTVSLPAGERETADAKIGAADGDGCSMQQLLTELSGVVSYDKYTQLYMD